MIEEATEMAKEAIEAYLEVMHEDGPGSRVSFIYAKGNGLGDS